MSESCYLSEAATGFQSEREGGENKTVSGIRNKFHGKGTKLNIKGAKLKKKRYKT